VDVTPRGPTFLFGYPHVPRLSTGMHDPLECAAFFLESGNTRLLFLANDVIFVSKSQTAEIRRRIFERTGIPEEVIMVTATHTHSGPPMIDYVSNASDPVVPPADGKYLEFFIERVVTAAEEAVRTAVIAEIGSALARADGIGTNRHDPAGPSDLDIPVLVVRSTETKRPVACMLVCAMHPTVLHEDSTLFSADFPYYSRGYLRRQPGWESCAVLFLQGASGDQSPRHVTRANTFAEAQRLGEILGSAVAVASTGVEYVSRTTLSVRHALIDLIAREFPSPDFADRQVLAAGVRFLQSKDEGASRQAVRTAECDLFGAQETAELARAAEDGRLSTAIAACLPAEIQAMAIGSWTFVGWPGEFFVEYALELRRRVPNSFVVTMANGELQGYIATEEAAARCVYEASNAVFSSANGRRFVEATLALLDGVK
jgi:hypothetical protein